MPQTCPSLDAEIRKKGNSVRIKVPITFKNGTAAQRSKFVTRAERTWSGTFGKYKVVTRLVAPSANDRVGTNTVEFANLGRSGKSTTFADRTAMRINLDNPANEAAGDHEVGHLLNLQDRYSDKVVRVGDQLDKVSRRVSAPDPGWSGNIMAELGGKVEERNIDEAIDAGGPRQNVVIFE